MTQPLKIAELARSHFHVRHRCKQVAQLWQRDRESSINDFRWGSTWGYYRLKSYFSRHCDKTQFTLTHHMVNKPCPLLGLAAEYRSRRGRRWCNKHCGRPSNVYDTDRRTKLTALEMISHWLLLKKRKKSLFETPFRALRGNVRTPSMVRWQARVDFIFVIIELFSLSPTVRRYERKSVKVGVLRRGWVTLNADFRGKGASPLADQPLLVSE